MNGVPLDNEGIKTKANNNTNKNNDYKTQPESSKPKLWKIEEDHLAEEKQTEPTTSDFPADQLQCQKRRRSTITLAGTALSTYKAPTCWKNEARLSNNPHKNKARHWHQSPIGVVLHQCQPVHLHEPRLIPILRHGTQEKTKSRGFQFGRSQPQPITALWEG